MFSCGRRKIAPWLTAGYPNLIMRRHE